MSKTLIRHITHKRHLDSILRDGLIKLEGCNKKLAIQRALANGNQDIYRKLYFLKKTHKLIGRYVWLTEDAIAKTSSGRDNPCSFEFYAEDIKAKKWSEVKRKFTKKQAILFVNQLDKIAIEMGDNPDKYWVCERPINLVKTISKQSHNLKDAA